MRTYSVRLTRPYNRRYGDVCQGGRLQSTKLKVDRELFATRLRVRLAELGWKPPQLATALRGRGLKISRQQTSAWSRGEAYPSVPAAAFVPAVLGVTAEWLFLGRPLDERDRGKSLLAVRVARAIEHRILTGNPESLVALANWIERLADDLHKVDPTYDTEQLLKDAEELRRMAG